MKTTVRQAAVEDHLLFLRLLPELGVDDPPPDASKWATDQGEGERPNELPIRGPWKVENFGDPFR